MQTNKNIKSREKTKIISCISSDIVQLFILFCLRFKHLYIIIEVICKNGR